MTKLADIRRTADDWHDQHVLGLGLAFDRIETLYRVADRACEDETAIHALSASEAEAVTIAVLAVVSAHHHVTFEKTFQTEQAKRN